MNLINPYTNKPETKAERISRYQNAESTYRQQAATHRGGFKAKFTKMANEKAMQIAKLKTA